MAYKLIDIRKTIPKHKTRTWKKRTSADTIVVHTTGSSNQDPNKTALYHVTPSKNNHISKLGCAGLCYSDFITKNGTVFHCNNYDDITWHAGFYNTRSVSVVLAFPGQTDAIPDQIMMNVLEQHLVVLCLYLKILPKRVIGHREVPGMYTILGNGSKKYKKVCPGMQINLDILRNAVTCRLQRRLSSEGLYTAKIDGLFGSKSILALNNFIPRR